jgi:hypothetical protein
LLVPRRRGEEPHAGLEQGWHHLGSLVGTQRPEDDVLKEGEEDAIRGFFDWLRTCCPPPRHHHQQSFVVAAAAVLHEAAATVVVRVTGQTKPRKGRIHA